jgi:hypothetical protein
MQSVIFYQKKSILHKVTNWYRMVNCFKTSGKAGILLVLY